MSSAAVCYIMHAILQTWIKEEWISSKLPPEQEQLLNEQRRGCYLRLLSMLIQRLSAACPQLLALKLRRSACCDSRCLVTSGPLD